MGNTMTITLFPRAEGQKFDFERYKKEGDITERTGSQASGGPRGLGDPYDRTLNKKEEDPLIPQRVMDISKTVLCKELGDELDQCIWDQGAVMMFFRCVEQRDSSNLCLTTNFGDPELHAAVKEEYLNERSHYRTTGIKQKRYMMGKFMPRDTMIDPPLDKERKYR
eukprot:GFUD01136934.1.p1 GENE.GFUD01136934.1~~GFUD01136934.1.p1  ORF type:complete len:166 (-),score=38.95 GFUD01136934.1:195-692(-)